MTTELTTEQTKAAVSWWADKLVACKHSGLSAEERRQPENSSYQLAEMFMAMSKPKVSAEQVDKFKVSLFNQIQNLKPYCISVDYGPDSYLRTACDSAGIDAGMGTLPIKTTMWLDDGKVTVRYGYGAEPETIFPAK